MATTKPDALFATLERLGRDEDYENALLTADKRISLSFPSYSSFPFFLFIILSFISSSTSSKRS